MPEEPPKDEAGNENDPRLTGTTHRIYRYMMKKRNPVGISQVQKDLALSSSSVAEYHLKKLLQLGLIREDRNGYVVDKVVLDNVIRIRRISIPVQTAYATFFAATLIILILFLRPQIIDSVFFFALVINACALAIFIFEAIKAFRRL